MSSSTRSILAEVSPEIACRSANIHSIATKRLGGSSRLAKRKNSFILEAGSKGKKDRTDLSEYFGSLKDNPVLDKLEAESRRIREAARPRTDDHEYQSSD
jgi:hypothetical protein